MSKLNDYLESKKLDTRKVLATSKRIEALTPEDRRIREARKRVKSGKPSDAQKELAGKKPRSGKPVTAPLMKRALGGEAVSAAAKGRILRAVNQVLETKKAGTAELGDLF